METKTPTPIETKAGVCISEHKIDKNTNKIDSTLISNELNTLSKQFEAMPETITKPTISELLTGAEIDLTKPLPKPPICLYLDDASLFYLGDVSTTIGKAKGRKTFASGLFMAALAGNCTIQNRIKADLPENKRTILSFDTEQGAYHAQKAAKRVLRLLNVETLPNFKVYGLRKFNPAEKLQIIEHAIYNTPDLGFVFIDGIRDLITSINDEEQATMITSKLMKWSEELNIHINCILHMNKGDNNARGHVGTELMNKSLTVLGVTKNEKQTDYSTVEPIACRDKDPDPFTFGINDDGLPYLLEPEQMEILQKLSESKTKKSLQPTDYRDDTHTDNLKLKIFNNQSERKYSELVSCVQNTYSIGENKAKNFVTYFIDKNFVSHTGNGRNSVYKLAV